MRPSIARMSGRGANTGGWLTFVTVIVTSSPLARSPSVASRRTVYVPASAKPGVHVRMPTAASSWAPHGRPAGARNVTGSPSSSTADRLTVSVWPSATVCGPTGRRIGAALPARTTIRIVSESDRTSPGTPLPLSSTPSVTVYVPASAAVGAQRNSAKPYTPVGVNVAPAGRSTDQNVSGSSSMSDTSTVKASSPSNTATLSPTVAITGGALSARTLRTN